MPFDIRVVIAYVIETERWGISANLKGSDHHPSCIPKLYPFSRALSVSLGSAPRTVQCENLQQLACKHDPRKRHGDLGD